MEFTCHTKYDQKALTAMARAVRKTVRAKRSRMVRIWAWIIIALLAVSLWISWGNVWQTAADCAVIVALLVIGWKEDAINGNFASRRALPGPDAADTAFYPAHFRVGSEMCIRDRSWPWRRPGRTWSSSWERTTPWPSRRRRWRAAASRNSAASWRNSPGRTFRTSEDKET